MPKRTSVYIGAHDDDPMLGAFGQMHQDLQEGKDVHIVILTDGRFSHEAVFGITDHPTPDQLVAKRKQELINAAKVLGIKEDRIHFIGEIDGSGDKWRDKVEILAKLQVILEELKPKTVYYHSNLDAHVDHRAVNNLVSKILAGRTTKAWQYVIWSKELAEGRKDVDVSKITAIPEESRRVKLAPEILALKRQAIMCHKSQVETNPYPQEGWQVQPGQILDQKFLDHFLVKGEEVFIEAK
jgi:LmbE family N-acetylglucosaminyl deacetylase